MICYELVNNDRMGVIPRVITICDWGVGIHFPPFCQNNPQIFRDALRTIVNATVKVK